MNKRDDPTPNLWYMSAPKGWEVGSLLAMYAAPRKPTEKSVMFRADYSKTEVRLVKEFMEEAEWSDLSAWEKRITNVCGV